MKTKSSTPASNNISISTVTSKGSKKLKKGAHASALSPLSDGKLTKHSGLDQLRTVSNFHGSQITRLTSPSTAAAPNSALLGKRGGTMMSCLNYRSKINFDESDFSDEDPNEIQVIREETCHS